MNRFVSIRHRLPLKLGYSEQRFLLSYGMLTIPRIHFADIRIITPATVYVKSRHSGEIKNLQLI